ncbi:hypothetical protein [Nostoc sp. CCY0012]|uniref:hypothetical protein n=1 Tax=Nostoc sp. CCY0012 TaxID=1056123 RepID=UPI0039C7338E
MNFMDGLLLTLLNTVVCLCLPKVLSVMAAKSTSEAPKEAAIQSSESSSEIPGVMDAA